MAARRVPAEAGVTLIELMVTMVIAMVILAGLFTTFIQENKQYRYQNERVDAVQDLEFVIKFIGDDLRASLVSTGSPGTWNPAENNAFAGSAATTALTFWVWDTSESIRTDERAQRKIYWDSATNSLRYDRQVDGAGNDSTGSANSEILPNVTFFKVFRDGTTPRAGFADIPPPLSPKTLVDANGDTVVAAGYTILVEVAVDSAYDEGTLQDVQGNATSEKRVWRYVQVRPMAAVP